MASLMAPLPVIARHVEGTELCGRTAMSMKTSEHKVKLVPMFGTMPYLHFTSAPSADAWHFGVGYERTKQAKLELLSI
jgi:hypothetical protein